MNIAYTYEIISVDETARCMELRYTSEGRQPVNVGARLPYTGETVDQIAAMYAPVGLWVDAERPVVIPTAGATGSYAPPGDPVSTLSLAKDAKRTAINVYRERVLAAGVVFNGYQFDSDPLSVTRLTAVATAVSAGATLPDGFTWRSTANVDVPFTGAMVVQLLATMIQTANSVYQESWEKKQEVDAAETVEAVDAVAWAVGGVEGGV